MQVRHLGVPLVSRCNCCVEGRYETVQLVWGSIKHWVNVLAAEISRVQQLSEWDLRLLNRMDTPVVKPRPSKVHIVR